MNNLMKENNLINKSRYTVGISQNIQEDGKTYCKEEYAL